MILHSVPVTIATIFYLVLFSTFVAAAPAAESEHSIASLSISAAATVVASAFFIGVAAVGVANAVSKRDHDDGDEQDENDGGSAQKKAKGKGPADNKPKPYRCDFPNCGKSYANKGQLDRHKLNHNKDNWLKCDVCDYRCPRRDMLEAHRTKHFEDRKYKCDECKVAYKQPSALNAHNAQKHRGHRFICPFCPYTTSLQHHFGYHVATHNQVRPFPCKYDGCDFAACQLNQLHIHEAFHEDPEFTKRLAKERAVLNALVKEFGTGSWGSQLILNLDLLDPNSKSSKRGQARIDMYLKQGGGLLIHLGDVGVWIEVDEFQHRMNGQDAESNRLADAVAVRALMGITRPLVIFRYNPDGFQVGTRTPYIMSGDRISTLIKKIKSIEITEDKDFQLHYLFYTTDVENGVPAVLNDAGYHQDVKTWFVSHTTTRL